jgi:hypothetical protein
MDVGEQRALTERMDGPTTKMAAVADLVESSADLAVMVTLVVPVSVGAGV